MSDSIKEAANAIFVHKYLDAAMPGYWMTAQKENIPIKEMGNGHLRNAILMLKRKDLTQHNKYGELMQEAARRGWSPDKGDFFLDGAL